MSLEGKTAIVTGAASGIGLAIVRRFLQQGVRVVIADMDHAKGEAAADDLSGSGEVHFIRTDVSKRLDVHNLVALAIDHFETIDILVNNAAILEPCPFLDLHDDALRRVLDVNISGAFLASQTVARQMVERIEDGGPAGVIVNISSISAQAALEDHIAYCVSKAGMDQLTRSMAVALGRHGIRVNGVAPGAVATELLAERIENEGFRSEIDSRTPLGRFGQPSEIAKVVAFLASDDAAYMTGETVLVDGGRRALGIRTTFDTDDG